MARGRKKGHSKQKTQEILHSQVRLDGQGEDPLVRDLLNTLAGGSEEDAIRLSIALYEQLHGKELDGERKSKLISRAIERDKALLGYELDRENFIEDTWEQGQKEIRKLPKAKRDQIKARAGQKFQSAVSDAKTSKAFKNAEIRHRLQHDPREKIVVEPNIVQLKSGETVVVGEDLRVMGFRFILRPGEQTVPKYVADLYRQRLKSKKETEARKKVMKDYKPEEELNSAMRDINKEFQSEMESLPMAGSDQGGEVYEFGG